MVFGKEAQRRQKRRELDARRSKFRVRLGSWPESWSTLKDQLGFSVHSELANFLLNSYSSKRCSRCSGDLKNVISVTVASLNQLILLIHGHAQCCPLTPSLQTGSDEEDPEASGTPEAAVCLKISCGTGHVISWCPSHTEPEEAQQNEDELVSEPTVSGQKRSRERRRDAQEGKPKLPKLEQPSIRSRRRRNVENKEPGEKNKKGSVIFTEAQPEQDANSQEGSDADLVLMYPKISTESPDSTGFEAEDHDSVGDENPIPAERVVDAVPNSTNRGRERTEDQPQQDKTELRSEKGKSERQQTEQDEASQISRKRKRKPAPKLILPCEFPGCSKIFSTRQYLNHHMKYQHVHQKTFICSHPSCGKSFNFKKHLKEHEKLHSDQRDYICEFCARAFRTSSNLSVHRRIHTGEKPLQCEVCGYTCRQKASLNWHMRKHDAQRSYQFTARDIQIT